MPQRYPYRNDNINQYRVRSLASHNLAEAYVKQRKIFRHRKHVKHKYQVVAVLLLVGLVIAVSMFLAYGSGLWTITSSNITKTQPQIPILGNFNNGKVESSTSANSVKTNEILTTPINIADINDSGFLRLINHDHSISADVSDELLADAWINISSVDDTTKLHKDILPSVGKLFDAAKMQSGQNLVITSGFRSYDEQSVLYDSYEDKSYVHRPGHSEHQSGLAVDIADLNAQAEENSDKLSRSQLWLAEHSWKYGLILRYPDDKQEITGIAYEPWHFRYVGKVHAWYMQLHGLCFEEYLKTLRDIGGYTITLDEQTHYVFYQKPIDNVIYIPGKLKYNVSGDGSGGYIIETWG